jgi:hypothetical protein
MKANKVEQIKAHAQAIAELLYEETDSEQVKTLEGIEEAVRTHRLPPTLYGFFFVVSLELMFRHSNPSILAKI